MPKGGGSAPSSTSASRSQLLADTVVTGVLVSPRGRSSTWGYERRGEDGPVLIARLQRWLHRGSFLVAWDDVELVDTGRLVFRASYERLDPMLPQAPKEP
jgi:hypothetical protein